MNKKDWNSIQVGDIIMTDYKTRFFVHTVEHLEKEGHPPKIGHVWNRDSAVLTSKHKDLAKFKLVKYPALLPVINGIVRFPGDPLWPRLQWPYHPDARPGQDEPIY